MQATWSTGGPVPAIPSWILNVNTYRDPQPWPGMPNGYTVYWNLYLEWNIFNTWVGYALLFEPDPYADVRFDVKGITGIATDWPSDLLIEPYPWWQPDGSL